MNKALTGGEIYHLTDEKCRVLTYSELINMPLSEILQPHGAACVLYETYPGSNYGHWVGIILHDKNTRPHIGPYIEQFDSYGMLPDEEFKLLPKNNTGPELLKKYIESGLPIEYNNHKLQTMHADSSTCGRWVALRIRYKDMNIDDFANFMKKIAAALKITPDELTVLMTEV